MAEPRVSVIVRSMARPSLAAALQSIAVQDHPAVEVLVVAACGAAHPPVGPRCGAHAQRLVASGMPLPRPAAANAGLDAATGDWVTFLDDDDLLLPGHLSGLVAAHAAAPRAGVVYSYARAVFATGRVERFGQPWSRVQLFERNFIHLSTALVDRRLIAAGCRFDETLDVHEDWDFFIQLAERTPFHFVPVQTFQWNADAGTSGAGGGADRDDAKFAAFRDRVYAKWMQARDALVDRVAPLLQSAAAAARSGDLAGAEAACRSALAASPNDPWALNVLAMVFRSAGRMADARSAQELAVAVRPQDPAIVYNLALLYRALGETAGARRCAQRALALAPDFAPAQALLAALPATPNG
jgi:tetratricopeptide (TPR) repeat protein